MQKISKKKLYYWLFLLIMKAALKVPEEAAPRATLKNKNAGKWNANAAAGPATR